MLINEILKEFYSEGFIEAVQDLLAMAMAKDIKKISTEKFRNALARQGYDVTIDQIIQAVDQSDYASSVNDTEIIPANQMSGDVDTDSEPSVDVGKMAGNQALSDIKSEL
jgi:hypothetical protein